VTGRARTLWIFILVLVRRREEAKFEESRGSESGFESEEDDGERCDKEGRGENVADDALMRWTMDRTSAEPGTRSSEASCFCSSTSRLGFSLLLAPSPGRTAAAAQELLAAGGRPLVRYSASSVSKPQPSSWRSHSCPPVSSFRASNR